MSVELGGALQDAVFRFVEREEERHGIKPDPGTALGVRVRAVAGASLVVGVAAGKDMARRFRLARFIDAVTVTDRRLGTVLIAAVAGAAVSVWGAVEVSVQLAVAKEEVRSASSGRVVVPEWRVSEVKPERIAAVARRVEQAFAPVAVKLEGNTVVVSADTVEAAAGFWTALVGLEAADASVRWPLAEVCLGEGCAPKMRARLTPKAMELRDAGPIAAAR